MLRKTITIAEYAIQDKRVKITDEKGLTWSIWKTNRDGETQAYEQWNTLPEKNITTEVLYSEKPGDYNGKAITYRTIEGFVSLTPSASQQPEVMAKKIKTDKALRQSVKEQITETTQVDWDKIAEGKVRNSIAVAFIGRGKEINESKVEMNKWVRWVMDGDFTSPSVEQELPTFEKTGEEDEVRLEDIPF